jgi:hypothetical protein
MPLVLFIINFTLLSLFLQEVKIHLLPKLKNAKENVSDDAVEALTAVKHVIDELCPDEVYTSSEVAECIGETSFRYFQCRIDGQNIVITI